jgi:hypothetical protein
MKLQKIRLQRLDNTSDRGIVGIHRECDLQRTIAHLTPEAAGIFKSKVSGRRREEDKPDHVGACFKRRVERFFGSQPANLHKNGHFWLRRTF